MIPFKMAGHAYEHDLQTVIQIFFPNEQYHAVDELPPEGVAVESCLQNGATFAAVHEKGEQKTEKKLIIPPEAEEKERRHLVKRAAYEALRQYTGYCPPWGFMTGIRPAKVMTELRASGTWGEQAVTRLMEQFDVSRDKAELSLEVSVAEDAVLARRKRTDASLYIGIPFCPSRCLYCSFPAYPIAQYREKVDAYLDALFSELAYIKEWSDGRWIKNIYIGGGTPTSLNEAQTERLLAEAVRLFGGSLMEFTVEAGRPDTITEEKLRLFSKYGVNRISINPQTMNDKTLQAVGRAHTVEDIRRVFWQARDAGHKNINMDLILGLPGEGPEEARHTMQALAELDPENITVHTLAVKRASRLREEFSSYTLTDAQRIEEMLRIMAEGCRGIGLLPYYMYRQKNMLGSFENVGYAKKGFEGVYNIEIMEERQTIFAAGAGAATKVVDPDSGQIERVFNVKNVDEYISRISEMIERKRKFRETHTAMDEGM